MNKQIKKAILRIYKDQKSHSHPGWFIVNDDRLEKYLYDNLNLYTDWVEHNVENVCIAVFNWKIQKWMIK